MVGQEVRLCGWMTAVRDFGNFMFVVIRDAKGAVQLMLDENNTTSALRAQVASWRLESVIGVRGQLRLRPEDMRNPSMPTGDLEVLVTEIELLNLVTQPSLPFPSWSSPLHGNERHLLPAEEIRLKYRYLDLRRPYLQENLRLRSKLALTARTHLQSKGFVEVETPTLFRSTPEGAREFLVPTRTRGKFYSLPQSPQQYKQLLMAAGVDKYFQFARCYRDEGIRFDRQPEFTQIDMEMSFVTAQDVCETVEGLIRSIWAAATDTKLPDPFPHITYREALDKYGSDKPDTRYDMHLHDVTHILQNSKVQVLTAPLLVEKQNNSTNNNYSSGRNIGPKKEGLIKAINVKQMADLSKDESQAIQKKVRDLGGKGVVEIRCETGGKWKSPIEKYLTDQEKNQLRQVLKAEDGDLLLIASGNNRDEICNILGGLRVHCAKLMQQKGKLNLSADQYNFLWVEEFPLFTWEKEEETKKDGISMSSTLTTTDKFVLKTTHHPFTAPHPDDIHMLYTKNKNGLQANQDQVRGLHYDCVVNGVELGGGSIRIHNEKLQRDVFQILGIKDEVANRFQHLLDALSMGCPPHGGLALGFDRLVAILCKAESLREVIAFPKTATGNELMTGAPAEVPSEELREYFINVVENPAESTQK
jgi:aspartyl-tRNA synthetase